MCELRAASPSSTAGRRRKLWEIRPDLHCSVLGTCLGHADLLKIGRKAGFMPSETATSTRCTTTSCTVPRSRTVSRA